MRNAFLYAALTPGLVLLTGCDLDNLGEWGDRSSSRYTADFHYSYPLKPGGRVSMDNANGSIEIAGWDENTVEISGVKYAGTPELRDDIKIDVAATADSVSIRTILPVSRRGNTGAKYIVKVPRKTQLDRIVSTNGGIRVLDVAALARLKTTNGSIRAEKLGGSLDVQTSNGSVEALDVEGACVLRTSNGRLRAEGIRGGVEGSTTNGSISVRLAKAEAGRPVRLETSNGGVELTVEGDNRSDIRIHTTNGGITLRLPDRIGARLIASTSHASIRSEFDVAASGINEKHRLEGTIGAGGPTIDVSTSNGSIRILRMM
jgi:DUF4097 and DUF4098 domain-containing protein YvlB